MRDFVDTLPLRLAAVVAAVVGVICLVRDVDLWVSVARVGVAFGTVLLGALGVRRLLSPLLSPAVGRHNADPSAANAAPGAPAPAGAPTTASSPEASETTSAQS